MITGKPHSFLATIGIAAIVVLSGCSNPIPEEQLDAEAIIVGAGISGLSAAVEMGRAGVDVLVIDMNSVPGGHAVMAGGFAVVDTPLQEAAGYTDSPDLAVSDWLKWTEDGDPYWTRFYAENSREMLYDWGIDLGVEWNRVAMGGFENSLPRFHFTEHGALDVVQALVRTVIGLPTVNFIWNKRVESILVDNSHVTGVEVMDVRTGETRTLRGEHIVIATGGFEGNLDKVLSNWIPGTRSSECCRSKNL